MDVLLTVGWWLHFAGFALVVFAVVFLYSLVTYKPFIADSLDVWLDSMLLSSIMAVSLTSMYFTVRVGWLLM